MPHDFLEVEEEKLRAEEERRKRDAVPCEEPGMKPMTAAFQGVIATLKIKEGT